MSDSTQPPVILYTVKACMRPRACRLPLKAYGFSFLDSKTLDRQTYTNAIMVPSQLLVRLVSVVFVDIETRVLDLQKIMQVTAESSSLRVGPLKHPELEL